jgi:8-oxo-dGTP pyrophosphatase MutT (NUDIX family)
MDQSNAYGIATLVLPVQGEEVWLGKKTRNIGVGTLNGPGGGIELGEDRRQSAAREVGVEAGIMIDPEKLEAVAILDCYNRRSDGSIFHAKVFVYIAREWEGNFTPSEEMTDWEKYPINDLPFKMMMPGDPYWLPEVLIKGRRIHAELHYGLDQKYLESEPIIDDVPIEVLNL